jgi:UDP-N-acetylmuramoylalanine--D-glutamate ligase
MNMKTIVLGLGISGRSSAELLLLHKKPLIALDRRAHELQKDPQIEQLITQGMILQSDQAAVHWREIEQVILSPGVPQTHPIVLQAMQWGVDVLGEIELAFRYLNNPCIGVTGTNGKTTVVMLIHHVLKSAGKKTQALGNIGAGLSFYARSANPEDILVVELSSFQLETLKKKCLDAALITNITPDHLDRYPSMNDYARAKCQIEQCLENENAMWVSRQVQQDYGHLLNKPRLFEDVEWGAQAIATVSSMRYIQAGAPERKNVQAAYPICRSFGVTDAQFWTGVETFRKPKYRIEFVGEWNAIAFYNDSKATNIDSVMHAVGLFSGSIILLAGGVHKGASYRPWVESFQGKVVCIVAFGQAAAVIKEDLQDRISVDCVENLEQAVSRAVERAASPVTILLSPGCSSFDQFRDYEHRGAEFKRIVEEKYGSKKNDLDRCYY